MNPYKILEEADALYRDEADALYRDIAIIKGQLGNDNGKTWFFGQNPSATPEEYRVWLQKALFALQLKKADLRSVERRGETT